MRWRWLATVLFAAAVVLLAIVILADMRRAGFDDDVVGSIDRSGDSVIVCADGMISQRMVAGGDLRTLFRDVSCPEVFRWQLDADFERLLTEEMVGEGRHVFVTSLDGTSYDLSRLMGFESTFDGVIQHEHPRFDAAGRVLIRDGQELLIADPTNGAFERVSLPTGFDANRWAAGAQCDGDLSLAQLSSQLVTLCPWGWFNPFDSGDPLFFIRRTDPPVLVAQVPSPPRMLEFELAGDFGVCAGPDPRFYWVQGTSLCQGDGLGIVQYDLEKASFSVTPTLAPRSGRQYSNAIVDGSGSWTYFTTDSLDGSTDATLWRVPTSGGEPVIVGAAPTDPFTLLGAP